MHMPEGAAPPTWDLLQLVDMAHHPLSRPGDHRSQCAVLHLALGGKRLDFVKEACALCTVSVRCLQELQTGEPTRALYQAQVPQACRYSLGATLNLAVGGHRRKAQLVQPRQML